MAGLDFSGATPAAAPNVGTQYNAGVPQVQSQGITLPTWYGDITQQLVNQLGGMGQAYQNLPQQWYNQPLTAGLTNLQTSALQNAGAPAGALAQFQTQYDPSKTQQFMDPYSKQAVNSMYTMANRNLTEGIIPSLNTTFTGAGQFGGSRNAEFMNRAIRDTQQAAGNTAANMYNQQFNNAMQQQYLWNQAPLTAFGAQWQNLQNQYGMGQQAQNTAQQALANNYQNWLTQLQMPQQLLGNLGTTLANITSRYQPATTQTTTSQPAQTSPLGILSQGLYGLGNLAMGA